LLLQHQLPGGLRALPREFTRFLQSVEALPVTAALDAPAILPPPPAGLRFPPLPEIGCRPPAALPLRGGSAAGQRRLQQYLFGEEQILDYPLRRKALDPLAGSSTLSPWLASGALSVRELAHGISRFEQSRQRSVATSQFRQALWRREFFHWYALLHGHRLFRAAGLSEPTARKHRLCTFDPRAFARWCQGDTDYPLVNALQRQLLATGWMSHCGRQLSASCLINELGLDWRFGAAFFEKHLIDHEVGSNYGNWQYLAGVNGDPSGGRVYNLVEQAAEHDPDGVFTAKWGGDRPVQPEFAMDAADWPLPPPATDDDQESD
jgi:deoxyribodipyrimidine photo-lyase